MLIKIIYTNLLWIIMYVLVDDTDIFLISKTLLTFDGVKKMDSCHDEKL